MKLKNKHTIALFHVAIIVAVLAAAVAGIIGFSWLFLWSGLNPSWLFVVFIVGGMYKVCVEDINDEDDWL